jgi:hypothetical protein
MFLALREELRKLTLASRLLSQRGIRIVALWYLRSSIEKEDFCVCEWRVPPTEDTDISLPYVGIALFYNMQLFD